MKNIVLVLIFVLFQRTVYGWYAMEYRNSTQKSKEECESADVHIGKMQLGEFRNLEDCVQAVCGEKGILYLGCNKIEQNENCTIVEGNNTMAYPECCPACH
ncbi:hypothetical protein RN001_011685 [Aquatica leii]|uniref:Single domain-containing protein n=1 Tax=Aquatica leii TaxID=1421715 RepID=A0AAN7SM47_9COLE|nr:hypothetical protein RN001_011685 [Aquatica leii]